MPDVDVTDHVIRIQRLVGADPDGWPGLRTAEAVEARLRALGGVSTIPAPPRADESQPPTLRDGSSGQHRAVRPLGEMALEWCLYEAGTWGAIQVSTERIRDYLRGCHRDGETATGTWFANTYDPTNPDRRWSFCIAAQGFAEDRAGGHIHSPMPPWRAGVFEAERDAADGKRPGEQWVPIAKVWDAATNRLLMTPPPGSIVIYGNRTAPGKGHAERLIRATAEGICSVGANENSGRWVIDTMPIPWTRLERADGSQKLYLRGFISPV